jgi:GABA(A) receptor-associated protein
MYTDKGNLYHRQKYDLETRRKQSQAAIDKHPHKIPVIISSKTISIQRSKFLVPEEMTVMQFHTFLRNTLIVSPGEALFTFVDLIDEQTEKRISSILPQTTQTFESLYRDYKHIDNFLVLSTEREAVFG